MNVSNPLLLGIALIAAGLALGLLAYAVILNRDNGDEEQEAEGAPIPSAEGPSEVPEEREPPAEPTPQPIPSPPAAPAEPPPQPVPSPPAPVAAGRIRVATILRDEVSGHLIVQIDDKEYHSAGELRDTRFWTRIERASSDLAAWFRPSKQKPAPARPEALRQTVPDQEQEKAPERVSGDLSMIEQIDVILQRKLEGTTGGLRGVRLVEGAGGAVRVFMGVQSYSLEEVPSEEVRRLIREAVQEWEAQQ